MNWIVYHIVSGQSFFSGVALILFAAWASTRTESRIGRFTTAAFLPGFVAVLVSSAAIPVWTYQLTAVTTLFWMATRFKNEWRGRAALAVAMAWLLAAGLELQWHMRPAADGVFHNGLTVIGDSVTAGVGDESETWPKILARQHSIDVLDLSHVGDTVALATKRMNPDQIQSDLVIIELGGNDLLGTTTVEEFSRNLVRLKGRIEASGFSNQVIMFELPLPPLYHGFGRAQREFASKRHVKLIPKRYFLNVIADGDATLDSIHLSQRGHQAMADCVWEIIRTAYNDD